MTYLYTFPEQRVHGRGMNFKNSGKVNFSQSGMITCKSDDGYHENANLLVSKDASQLQNSMFWKKMECYKLFFPF
jgi:hypothetical protein